LHFFFFLIYVYFIFLDGAIATMYIFSSFIWPVITFWYNTNDSIFLNIIFSGRIIKSI